MAISILAGRKEPGQIGELTLDATINESHDYVNEVSQYPVETGATISDHVRRQPERLTIAGFVSNTPVPVAGTEFTEQFAADNSDRVQTAFEILLDIAGYDYPSQQGTVTRARKSARKVDIVTGLRGYTDMICARLTIPRNAQTGQTLQFNAEFVHIEEAVSQIAIIQNVSASRPTDRNPDQASTKQDTGKQTTKPVSENSIAFRTVSGIVSKFK